MSAFVKFIKSVFKWIFRAALASAVAVAIYWYTHCPLCSVESPTVAKFVINYLHVDVNSQDEKGYTALHKAIRNGKYPTSGVLLDAGADPEIESKYGKNALDYALEKGSSNGKISLVTELFGKGVPIGNRKALVKAVSTHIDNDDVGALVVIAATVGGEWLVNAKYESGSFPLLHAVQEDNENAVKALLLLGAKGNREGPKGRTALMEAARIGKYNMVQDILVLGLGEGRDIASVIDDIDDYQWNALWYAVHKNDIKIVKLLLAFGAEPNHAVPGGKTGSFLYLYDPLQRISDEQIEQYKKAKRGKLSQKQLNILNKKGRPIPLFDVQKKFSLLAWWHDFDMIDTSVDLLTYAESPSKDGGIGISDALRKAGAVRDQIYDELVADQEKISLNKSSEEVLKSTRAKLKQIWGIGEDAAGSAAKMSKHVRSVAEDGFAVYCRFKSGGQDAIPICPETLQEQNAGKNKPKSGNGKKGAGAKPGDKPVKTPPKPKGTKT